jgi:hypothetical protein
MQYHPQSLHCKKLLCYSLLPRHKLVNADDLTISASTTVSHTCAAIWHWQCGSLAGARQPSANHLHQVEHTAFLPLAKPHSTVPLAIFLLTNTHTYKHMMLLIHWKSARDMTSAAATSERPPLHIRYAVNQIHTWMHVSACHTRMEHHTQRHMRGTPHPGGSCAVPDTGIMHVCQDIICMYACTRYHMYVCVHQD